MALSSELVRVRDGRFDVGGSSLSVVGANCYYLAYVSPRMRGDVLAVANQLGLNTIRALAFLDCKAASLGTVPEDAWRGVYFQCWDPDNSRPRLNEGADGLQRLDQLIADAEAAGIRLILPLVNHWPDFGGMDRYVEWFQAGSRDQFYRDARVRAAYAESAHTTQYRDRQALQGGASHPSLGTCQRTAVPHQRRPRSPPWMGARYEPLGEAAGSEPSASVPS
jgi:mannan endo-1,4-beta-mannosidase